MRCQKCKTSLPKGTGSGVCRPSCRTLNEEEQLDEFAAIRLKRRAELPPRRAVSGDGAEIVERFRRYVDLVVCPNEVNGEVLVEFLPDHAGLALTNTATGCTTTCSLAAVCEVVSICDALAG